NDPDTLELFKQHNVPLPTKAAAAAPPVLHHAPAGGNGANGASGPQAQQRRPPTVPPGTLQRPVRQHHAPVLHAQPQVQQPGPRRPTTQRRPAYVPPEESQSGTNELRGE